MLLSADEYTQDDPVWHGQVVLPNTLAGGIEYKFVKVSDTVRRTSVSRADCFYLCVCDMVVE